jgi:hypothetical protein
LYVLGEVAGVLQPFALAEGLPDAAKKVITGPVTGYWI